MFILLVKNCCLQYELYSYIAITTSSIFRFLTSLLFYAVRVTNKNFNACKRTYGPNQITTCASFELIKKYHSVRCTTFVACVANFMFNKFVTD